MRALVNLILLVLFVVGCKVQRPVATSKSESEKPKTSEALPVDSIFVTDVPPDSVDIEVHRVFPDTISIIGVGDIMLGTNYPDNSYLPGDSGKHLLFYVSDILKSADLTFGNLEGVILNDGGTPKKCNNPKACYLFRMPEYLAARLDESGFNVLSVANNHSGDFGNEGRQSTANILKSKNIYFAGFDTIPYTTFKRGEIIYGFAAFAPNKGTASLNDLGKAKEIVAHLDSVSDITIVSFHGGAEGKNHQQVTRETEFFYGENRGNVYEFSHALIDAGADVIFGHGPHVVRSVEVYNNRIIAYSLGNFCTYKRFNLRDVNAYAPILKIDLNSTGEFLGGRIISAIQTGSGIPKIDSEYRAARQIKALTEKDFPESKIFIGDSGVITYIQK